MRFVTIYFIVETIWLIYFAACLFTIETQTETHPGEPYRLTVALAAFHIVGLPAAVLFTLTDCTAWVLICFFATVLTDILNLMRTWIHVSPTDYEWARIMLFVLTSFALLLSTVMAGWRVYIKVQGICFTKEDRKNIGKKINRRLV